MTVTTEQKVFNATSMTLITSTGTEMPDQSPTTNTTVVVENATSITVSTTIDTREADTTILTDSPTTDVPMSFFTG